MTAKQSHKVVKERNTLLFGVIAAVVVIVGIAILVVSNCLPQDWVVMAAILADFGSLLIGGVGVALLWEFYGKRKFADEIFGIARVGAAIREAGIIDVAYDFHGLGWPEMINQSTRLDIFVTYARTWREALRQDLKKFLARPGTRLRVLLPDPNDDQTIAELSRRFELNAEDLRERINEAKIGFAQIGVEAGGTATTRIEIRLLPGIAPHCTFYLFDRCAVLSVYTHRRDKSPVPSFVANADGFIYTFVQGEMETLWKVCEKQAVENAPTPA